MSYSMTEASRRASEYIQHGGATTDREARFSSGDSFLYDYFIFAAPRNKGRDAAAVIGDREGSDTRRQGDNAPFEKPQRGEGVAPARVSRCEGERTVNKRQTKKKTQPGCPSALALQPKYNRKEGFGEQETRK
ncbi:hypothetical protein HPB50_004910 [Hyalomma asiaticum]|uniref:Uncharacterized protein n=1 Tax=Hyalomma asiaticum TaxID=266040 RepID=A0ACB7RHD9_HYAAI|nr:hypothetical protein HPB50_004910 [Hyalomma asiaticum]